MSNTNTKPTKTTPTTTPSQHETAYAVAAGEATEAACFTIIPEGSVDLIGADSLSMDAEGGAKAIAQFNERGNELLIDYEHHSEGGEYASPDGKVRAAGWIKGMEYVEGVGLQARVEWTDEAKSLIQSGEYKYHSPVYVYNKATREIEALKTMALTNTPRTKRMGALTAKLITSKGSDMAEDKTTNQVVAVEPDAAADAAPADPTMQLAVALTKAGVDVPEDASPEAIMAMVLEFIKGSAGGDGDDAEADEAAATLTTLGATSDEQGVLIAAQLKQAAEQVEGLKAELAELTSKEKGREVDAVIAKYIDENKLNPNDEASVTAATKMANRDLAEFTEFMESQTPIVASGRIVSAKPVTKDERASLIASSVREFKDSGIYGSVHAYVNESLREADLPKMTNDEHNAVG